MRITLLALVLLASTACRSTTLRAGRPAVAAYVPAAAAAAGPSTEVGDGLADFGARARRLAQEWEARVAHPRDTATFIDFGAEPLAAAVEMARGPALVAQLADGLTEPLLLAAAFERSPRIQAAELALRGTLNQYAQVTYLDTILSQYASFQRSSQTRVGMPLAGERLDQAFPFPGSLELQAALVKHAVEEAHAHYEGVVRDVLVSVRTTYARYVFVHSAMRLTQAGVEYLVPLEQAARSKLVSGRGAKGAVIQVQVELARLRNDLETLGQERTVLQAGVRNLLAMPADVVMGTPAPASPPLDEPPLADLRALAMIRNPEIRAIQARVQRMTTMIELAEQTAYPPNSAGLSTMAPLSHATLGSGKAQEPFTTRPKSTPDPWFGMKDAYLREARDGVHAAEARLQAIRNETYFAIESDRVEVQTARRLLALYRDVQLEQAEQAYRDALAGYAADRIEFLNVIDTVRRWLQFQLAADQALRDVHIGHARLEGTVGTAIP